MMLDRFHTLWVFVAGAWFGGVGAYYAFGEYPPEGHILMGIACIMFNQSRTT